MKRLRVAAVLVSLAVSTSGCGSSKARAVQTRSEEIPVEWTIELKGDRNLKVTQVAKSRFVVVRTNDKKRSHQDVFGSEPIDALMAGSVGVRAGFAINPFRGDGKYTIQPGSPHDAIAEDEKAKEAGRPRSRSSIQVEWWAPEDTFQYLRRAAPCKAEVKGNTTRGEVFCPDVTHDGVKEHFSIRMKWRVVEAKT